MKQLEERIEFENFDEFYTFYLREHSKKLTRSLHFIGTSIFLVSLFLAIFLKSPTLILLGIVFAYGLAWGSHFFIEKNRPATFRYPLYSLRGDFKMYSQSFGWKCKAP